MQIPVLKPRPHFSAPANTPLVVAHRGASGLAPENTLAAFQTAIAMGADGVELDVQLSADARPVVIHDRRVDRTTNKVGPVSRFTAQELNALDAGDWFLRRLTRRPRLRAEVEAFRTASISNRGYSDESVPTLEKVFSVLAPAKLSRIYVEIKANPETQDHLLRETISLVRFYGLERAAVLLSFDHSLIERAKLLAPEISTAVTFPAAGRRLATARSIIRWVRTASADEAALHFGLASRRVVAALHDAGISVSAWTANSNVLMRRLIAAEVDSIMTDYPNRLLKALESAESMNSGARRRLAPRNDERA